MFLPLALIVFPFCNSIVTDDEILKSDKKEMLLLNWNIYIYIKFEFKWILVYKCVQSYLNWWKLFGCGMRNHKFSNGIFEDNLFYFIKCLSEFLKQQSVELNWFVFLKANKVVCISRDGQTWTWVIFFSVHSRTWLIIGSHFPQSFSSRTNVSELGSLFCQVHTHFKFILSLQKFPEKVANQIVL